MECIKSFKEDLSFSNPLLFLFLKIRFIKTVIKSSRYEQINMRVKWNFRGEGYV